MASPEVSPNPETRKTNASLQTLAFQPACDIVHYCHNFVMLSYCIRFQYVYYKDMAKSAPEFVRPEKIQVSEERVPVSTRVPKDVVKHLEDQAKKSGRPPAKIYEYAIVTYSNWLKKQESSK